MKNIFTVIGISLAILFVGQTMGQANARSQIQDPDIVCTMEYAPVCGMPYFECPKGALCSIPVLQTYSNRCMLDAVNATFQYEGICEHEKPKACPENYAPVCGQTQDKVCLSLDCESHKQTYSNMCFLEVDNSEFLYEGKCEQTQPPKPELPKPTDTKYYVGDTKMCQIMKYTCEDDWGYFGDNIGCGCEKKETISDEMKDVVDTLLEDFIQKLKNKGYSDSKIVDTITVITVRLQILKDSEPRYRDIINYTLEKLREYEEEYRDDDLKIFKDIFKDF